MGTLWQDLQYGARMLIKARGFTAIAVLSLALGIGANTALFSVVDVLLLKKLPVKEPGRLVLFRSMASREFSAGSYTGNSSTDAATGQRTMTSFPYQSFERMREQESALSDIFAFANVGLNVSADGQADVATGQAVSGNYYAGLGVQPLLGRVLTEEDDKAGASAAAVLSSRYWKQRFGGNPSVIGKQINLNNVAFTIVGVSAKGFDGTAGVGSTQDVTIPVALEPQLYADKQRSNLNGAGNLLTRSSSTSITPSSLLKTVILPIQVVRCVSTCTAESFAMILEPRTHRKPSRMRSRRRVLSSPH